jgi:hypothetical protein
LVKTYIRHFITFYVLPIHFINTAALRLWRGRLYWLIYHLPLFTILMHCTALTATAIPLTLTPTEDSVYVLLPGSHHITLSLTTPGVRAVVVGLARTKEEVTLTITQEHLAPNTESHVLVKSIVEGHGNVSYSGKLHIAQTAAGSNASQEARGLLLSPDARFSAVPALEIFPKDVTCRHAVSAAPLSQDSLFTLATRGIAPVGASELLEGAFLASAAEALLALGIPNETVQTLFTHIS